MSAPSSAKIAALAVVQGFTVKRTKKGYMVRSKCGKYQVLFHHTPSDHRAHKNVVAQLRKIGVEI